MPPVAGDDGGVNDEVGAKGDDDDATGSLNAAVAGVAERGSAAPNGVSAGTKNVDAAAAPTAAAAKSSVVASKG